MLLHQLAASVITYLVILLDTTDSKESQPFIP